MANALILNLPGGRLTIGPINPEAQTLQLRLDTPTVAFQMAREVHLSRQVAAEVERAIGLWLSPPLPPTDLEGEQRLLGAILQKPALFEVLADQVTPEHFADPIHTAIWNAMHRMAWNSVPPTPEALRDEAERTGILDEVGGPAYVHHLSCAWPPMKPADAVLLARSIEEMGIDRRGVETPPWEARQ